LGISIDPPLLGGIPANGVFSGNGVISDGISYYFNPSVVGTGNHTVTYTITNEYGCKASVQGDFNVFNTDAAIIYKGTSDEMHSEMCVDEGLKEIALDQAIKDYFVDQNIAFSRFLLTDEDGTELAGMTNIPGTE